MGFWAGARIERRSGRQSTRWAFAQLLETGAAGILQPDVTVVGGVSEWLKVAHMAAAFDVPVAPHYNWDFHTQLCASSPNAIFVEYFLAGSGVKMFDSVLVEPMKPVGGYLEPRSAAGFGIELRWSEIDRYRIG